MSGMVPSLVVDAVLEQRSDGGRRHRRQEQQPRQAAFAGRPLARVEGLRMPSRA